MALSANTQITALIDAARDMFVTKPMLYWASIRGRMGNLPAANFDMGCAFAQRGAMRDAAMRFRIAVKLDPNFAQAWHNLGACLMQLGDKPRAMEAFQRTLALRPGDEEASYLLATINPSALPREAWPTRMPRTMIDRFFAAAAPYYAQVEVQNKYAGSQVCEQKILSQLAIKTGLNIVDLGCGVGLASVVWRDKAARITGVDVVPQMVQEARGAKSGNMMVFDSVIEGDLYAPDGITIPEASADIALLCNTSQFLGDLTGAMRGMQKWLKSGGVAAITVEPATGQAMFGVNPATGRFGHSAAYLQELANSHGFSVLLQERVNLYPDVTAGIVVLRKN